MTIRLPFGWRIETGMYFAGPFNSWLTFSHWGLARPWKGFGLSLYSRRFAFNVTVNAFPSLYVRLSPLGRLNLHLVIRRGFTRRALLRHMRKLRLEERSSLRSSEDYFYTEVR